MASAQLMQKYVTLAMKYYFLLVVLMLSFSSNEREDKQTPEALGTEVDFDHATCCNLCNNIHSKYL